MRGIYKITNKITGKVYIGESEVIEKRWYFHKNCFKRKRNSKGMQEDYNLYGLDSFEFEIVEEVKSGSLREKEQKYIILYNSQKEGYNTHLYDEEPKLKVEVFIEIEDISAIEKLAKEEGISRSNWIRDAVLEKLEREGHRNNKVLEGK